MSTEKEKVQLTQVSIRVTQRTWYFSLAAAGLPSWWTNASELLLYTFISLNAFRLSGLTSSTLASLVLCNYELARLQESKQFDNMSETTALSYQLGDCKCALFLNVDWKNSAT